MVEELVELRRKNQLTWPVADEMGISEGARLLVAYDPATGQAWVRSLKESYAGVLGGVYGSSPEEVREYLRGERAGWD
ncbi:MAG: hypothetical protein ACREPA_03840 [Candidatus Dormibacteraceae bacterium]